MLVKWSPSRAGGFPLGIPVSSHTFDHRIANIGANKHEWISCMYLSCFVIIHQVRQVGFLQHLRPPSVPTSMINISSMYLFLNRGKINEVWFDWIKCQFYVICLTRTFFYMWINWCYNILETTWISDLKLKLYLCVETTWISDLKLKLYLCSWFTNQYTTRSPNLLMSHL